MITIKGKDEAALVARIEKELKGEDVDIFQSDSVDYTVEEILGLLAYNAKQSRVYIGRLERNTRKMEEDIRHLTETIEPVSLYFTYLCEETLPEELLTPRMRRQKKWREAHKQRIDFENAKLEQERLEIGPKAMLRQQRETAEKLKAEGKAPEKE